MINRIQLLSLALFVATVSSGTIYAQNEILIKNGKEDYSIGRYISILEDRHNALSILQAASDSMKNKYTYKRKETLNYKFTGSSYWVRLVVVDTTSNPRMMTGGKNTEA
ncbi:MAG: hypothetical protein KGJ59_09095, partial [Bacteroidota bacterium]|nr:hypothetical protein [Bacteroidota bacterium]